MAARQREWARKARRKLVSLLGQTECQWCGAGTDLTFDTIKPTGVLHHEHMEYSWRMSFYRRQFDLGNLQILCRSCNARKSDHVTEVTTELNWEHLGAFAPF